jgi:D-cysteine desulfhydrase
MRASPSLAKLSALPRLGWIDTPSPVESLAALADEMRLDALWVKRDDQLGRAHGLFGSTKLRKLDVALAAAPWRDAPAWASIGAIGSGNLVALSSAARLLQRRLRAHFFWEPPLADHLENLAYVASGPGALHFSASPVLLALSDPRSFLSARHGEAAVLPPGASCLEGEMGVALGALELARQIDAGACEAPEHVFVPVGSAGTLVGLVVGLAIAGVRCTVHGVTVVERAYSLEWMLRARIARLAAALGADDLTQPTLRLHRNQLGPGYGIATEASHLACERAARAGLGLEAIYSGKSMAALRSVAPTLRGPVLFWLTPRRPGPLPVAPDWRARLPRALARRLDA